MCLLGGNLHIVIEVHSSSMASTLHFPLICFLDIRSFIFLIQTVDFSIVVSCLSITMLSDSRTSTLRILSGIDLPGGKNEKSYPRGWLCIRAAVKWIAFVLFKPGQ
jgi:hypothetical protein